MLNVLDELVNGSLEQEISLYDVGDGKRRSRLCYVYIYRNQSHRSVLD